MWNLTGGIVSNREQKSVSKARRRTILRSTLVDCSLGKFNPRKAFRVDAVDECRVVLTRSRISIVAGFQEGMVHTILCILSTMYVYISLRLRNHTNKEIIEYTRACNSFFLIRYTRRNVDKVFLYLPSLSNKHCTRL